MLLKMVPRRLGMFKILPQRAWIALGVFWVVQGLITGFAGAALYDLVF